MTFRILPALGAALLLAACGSSGSDSAGSMPATDTSTQLSNAGGVDSSGLNGNGGISSSEMPGSPGEFETKIGNTIHFDTDSYTLNAEAQGILQKQAAWLQQYPQHTVTIEGHADERGTREYNYSLGARRGQTVRDYLASRGIAANRMRTISYGKERPVAVCNDISCWSQNRRAVTVLNASS